MYISIYISTLVFIFIYAYMYICICIHIYIQVHMSRIDMCIYIYIYIYMYEYVYTSTYIYIHMHIGVYCVLKDEWEGGRRGRVKLELCALNGAIQTSKKQVEGVCNSTLSYNKLQHTATQCHTLPQPATHCNTLHHTAQHCTTLRNTATHCNTLQHRNKHHGEKRARVGSLLKRTFMPKMHILPTRVRNSAFENITSVPKMDSNSNLFMEAGPADRNRAVSFKPSFVFSHKIHAHKKPTVSNYQYNAHMS